MTLGDSNAIVSQMGYKPEFYAGAAPVYQAVAAPTANNAALGVAPGAVGGAGMAAPSFATPAPQAGMTSTIISGLAEAMKSGGSGIAQVAAANRPAQPQGAPPLAQFVAPSSIQVPRRVMYA